MSDVEISRAIQAGGWSKALAYALIYTRIVVSKLPVVVTRGTLSDLRNKAEGYDLAVSAWEEQKRENRRLRGDDFYSVDED